MICVDPALEHDNVELVTDAHVRRLETDPSGAPSPPWSPSVGRRLARRVRFTADVVVVACGAVNSAVLLLRSANDRAPERAGQRLRRRRPALHAAQQPGADGRVQGAQPHPVPEDPRPQRLVPRLPTTGTTRSAASRCSASPTPSRSAPTRRAGPAGSRPEMPFEVLAHHAVDFWLCGEDLPLPGQPGHPRRATARIHLALDEKNNIEGAQAAAAQAAGHARRPGHAPAPPARPQHLHAQGHADRRHRAPGRHGPVRHRPARARRST